MTVDDDLSDWDTGFDSHIGKSTIGDEEAGTSVTVGCLYANAAMVSSSLSVGKGTDEKGKNRKDVEFGIGGKVEAGFTAAEADAHVRYGDDKKNINGYILGASHSVSADASGAIGAFLDKYGNITGGFQGEAGFDAFIVEGEASAGFELFGINVDVSGSAGVGVSARAKVGVTTEKAEAKMKLGPVGLGLSIGW